MQLSWCTQKFQSKCICNLLNESTIFSMNSNIPQEHANTCIGIYGKDYSVVIDDSTSIHVCNSTCIRRTNDMR